MAVSTRPEDYFLRVTAGPSYDRAAHVEVPVNGPTPVRLRGPAAEIDLCVRIHGYERGLPGTAPTTSAYFATEPHAASGDTYSIALRFTAIAAPDQAAINGHDLQWGNDLDQPIRGHLPPGFNQALRIMRWWVDPGLVGDAYADRPHLYGPALSSFNRVYVGSGGEDPGSTNVTNVDIVVDEGGDEAGLAVRTAIGCPDSPAARQKWALTDEAKSSWTWEAGRTYGLDFFNGYIDFKEFAVRLPGFHLPVMPYWDGQSLRYVLRNRTTEQVYLVVEFSLVRREDVNEDGTIKAEVLAQRTATEEKKKDSDDGSQSTKEAQEPLETSLDDVE